MSLKNEITYDPKAAAWSALSAFRATFPAPTAENRAIEARLEADLTALREADGSLFDDRADELIRWADKNEALRPSKTDPQGVGSAITYGRRYSLLAMTGAAPEDDDGNAASGPRQERRESAAATGPSAAAQYAADQLRQAKTKDEFTHFWNSEKEGLRQSLSDGDYAHVVKVMQSEAKRFAPTEAANASTPFDEKDAA